MQSNIILFRINKLGLKNHLNYVYNSIINKNKSIDLNRKGILKWKILLPKDLILRNPQEN